MSTYLTNYKLGDYVDIKVNGAVHKVSFYERVWQICKSSYRTQCPPAMTRRQKGNCQAVGLLLDGWIMWSFRIFICIIMWGKGQQSDAPELLRVVLQ